MDQHNSGSPERPAVVFIREACVGPQGGHSASHERQLKGVEHLEELGYGPEQIFVVEARGENSQPGFEKLLQLVESGTVGMIVVSEPSRLSRNELGLRRLFDAAAQNSVLFLVGHQIFRPAPETLLSLSLIPVLQEFEARSRGRRAAMRRAARALE